MREALFIKKNIERWKKQQQQPAEHPDEVAEEFVQLLDDLAYAKTFYPRSKITQYINRLAATIYQTIYVNKKENENRIIRFWKQELPLLFYEHRKKLLFVFLFFIFFCALGVFSSAHDETFIRGLLGDDYVNMTQDNIAKGDPFGVYKQGNEFYMFVHIAINNIYVAFLAFVMGIIFSIGTYWILFKNGLMLGAFEYFFFSHGLGWQSVLTVFIHGTIEISAIVIAGWAGIIMGNSLLFPGTYPRLQSLQRGAKSGLKITVCLIPFFFTAAFLESHITRYTSMPVWLSISILCASLLLIIFYFIIYPTRVHKKISLPKMETT